MRVSRSLSATVAVIATCLSTYVGAVGTTEIVSRNDHGFLGNDNSVFPSISGNGALVAFHSKATNYSARATDGIQQVYVYDRRHTNVTLISVDSRGEPGNAISANPVISANGRFVAFWSLASNLVPNDQNAAEDVFVHDRVTRITERVSIGSGEEEGHDIEGGAIEDGHSVSLSAHGRYVTFWSSAPNLVEGDTNDTTDIFIRDRWKGTTERVTVNGEGVEANGESEVATLSANGRYVSFHSEASNLVPGDRNDKADVFVVDRWTGDIQLISKAAGGTQGNNHSLEPSISYSGRYVAFGSQSDNLVPGDQNQARDVFVFDRKKGVLERVSVDDCGNEFKVNTFEVALSGNGRFAVMLSSAVGEAFGFGTVWVYDRHAKRIEQVNVDSAGNPASGFYGFTDPALPAISARGRYIAFWSSANNLVANDDNEASDVFVRDRGPIRTPHGKPQADKVCL